MSLRGILASIAVAAGSVPASALDCGCAPTSAAAIVAAAPSAFHGDVVAVSVSKDGRRQTAEVLAGVDIKGRTPPRVWVTTDRAAGGCGITLVAGRGYDFAGVLGKGNRMTIPSCALTALNRDDGAP